MILIADTNVLGLGGEVFVSFDGQAVALRKALWNGCSTMARLSR
ncbi:MAG: hypothetical protein VKJ05_00715 [Synechococcaceae cyanobacterium]|nr:hypothetical protein [Synechococcaceae cyanobacterium]